MRKGNKMSAKPRITKERTTNNGATLGFEKRMWEAADTLRGSMDAAEYKHVVLGLIFLKHISDISGSVLREAGYFAHEGI
jgi:type I restriction enzyme M protein